MRFADPKNHLAFKTIFGNSKHKNIVNNTIIKAYPEYKITGAFKVYITG